MRRTGSLLHWSERSGTRQAYLLDLKSGESRQITDAADLDPSSLSLTPDEKSILFFDGPELRETNLSGARPRAVYRIPGKAAHRGFAVGMDGSAFVAESTEGGARIVRVQKQRTAVVADEPGIDLLLGRPRQGQIFWRSPAGNFLANPDGSAKRPVRFEPGRPESIVWAPSGRSLLYLHIPEDSRELISLRENIPEENSDREIARTSQFAAVSANADASVFAGASRGKASAYVLLLLRVTRKELTLCEHRASDARMVSPIFTPDSQSILFVSDRHGKSAVYRVRVDRFVESTEGN